MGMPQRTCIGCRRVRSKTEMIRIVLRPDGVAGLDPRGSEPGRGAYVCDESCARAARDRLARALRATKVDGGAIEEAVARAASQRRQM